METHPSLQPLTNETLLREIRETVTILENEFAKILNTQYQRLSIVEQHKTEERVAQITKIMAETNDSLAPIIQRLNDLYDKLELQTQNVTLERAVLEKINKKLDAV